MGSAKSFCIYVVIDLAQGYHGMKKFGIVHGYIEPQQVPARLDGKRRAEAGGQESNDCVV